MVLIKNKKHTIIYNGVPKIFNYNAYTIFEYCNILNIKDEVKHPTFKKEILSLYNL